MTWCQALSSKRTPFGLIRVSKLPVPSATLKATEPSMMETVMWSLPLPGTRKKSYQHMWFSFATFCAVCDDVIFSSHPCKIEDHWTFSSWSEEKFHRWWIELAQSPSAAGHMWYTLRRWKWLQWASRLKKETWKDLVFMHGNKKTRRV